MRVIVMCLMVTVLLATPVELRFYYADYVLPSLLQEYPPLRDAFCKCPPDLCVAVCPSLGVNGPILSGGAYGAKLFQRKLRDLRCHPEHVKATEGSLQSVYRFCCRTAASTLEYEDFVGNPAHNPQIVTENSKNEQLKEEKFEKDPEQEPLQEINVLNGSGDKSSAEDIQVEDVISDFVSDGLTEQPWGDTSTEPSSSVTGTGNSTDDANADDANADDANADDANADDANADGANADGANADGANADGANADGANADGANADDANADDANADDANADDANADGANADGANADGANADGANADDANADDANKDVVTDGSSLADEALPVTSSDALKNLTLWSDVSTAGALPHSEPTGDPPMLYVPTGDERTVYVPMKDSPTGSTSSSDKEKLEQAEKSDRVSKQTIESSSLNHSYSKNRSPQASTPSAEAPPATQSPVQTVLNRVRRVYDGYYISYKNSPWIGVVHFTQSAEGLLSFCSGSLIASRYVVTAAHCFFQNKEKLNATNISFGVTDITGTPGMVASIAKEIIHPGFSKTIYKNDIALVKLNEAVVPNSIGVRALHLPPVTLHPRLLTDIWVQIAGWGRTTKLNLSPWLQGVDLQVKENCCEHTRIYDANKQLCLVGPGDKSACIGDSGGAVTLRTTMGDVLVGVISRYGCGVGESTTSTFVSPYIPWILEVIYRHGE